MAKQSTTPALLATSESTSAECTVDQALFFHFFIQIGLKKNIMINTDAVSQYVVVFYICDLKKKINLPSLTHS